jgi:prepilin-type N-terminal cleavage/methylation domain-containing protein
MKKLNKKGFTLIEMLVVIAIIAVLVAIIIPTVSSATTKAAAATDAANLRSFKAEITTAYLSGDNSMVTVTETGSDNNKSYSVAIPGLKTPAMKALGSEVTKCEAGTAKGNLGSFEVTYNGTEFTVKYQGFVIADFAKVAEEGGTIVKSTTN